MTNPYGQQPGGYAQQPPPAQAQPAPGAPSPQAGFPGQAPQPGQPQTPAGHAPGAFPAQQPTAPGHPGGAFPAPPGQGGFPGQGSFGYGGPAHNYADWGKRVAAYLIDALPPAVVAFFGMILILSGLPVVGGIIAFLGWAGTFVWTLFNRWIQAGKTGQSLGKRQMGIKLIGEYTGQPIGAGNAFLRDLAHFLDGAALYIGFLWPLWDVKAQTFADKVVSTVVVRAEQSGPGGGQGFPQQPGGYPPQQPGYPAQQPGYPPQQAAFPPQQGGYPQQPQSGGFPQQPQYPQSGGYPQQPGQGYAAPPQQW